MEFFLAWFADPVYKGDYPAVMKQVLGKRLPTFTEAEKTLLKGSSDFFGLNHYTTMYACDATNNKDEGSVYGNGGLSEDQDVNLSISSDWKLTDMQWAIVPWGCKKILQWIAERYDNPPIFITENGGAFDDKLIDGKVDDVERVAFFKGYISAIGEAIESGVNVKGYFIWSLLDNFEWASGYAKKFGIHYVEKDSLHRIPKSSALWYAGVIAKNAV